MVRKIEISGEKVDIHPDKLEIHTDIGYGRILGITVTVEDLSPLPTPQTDTDSSKEQWERELDQLLALTPENPYPVDDSREAIYGPDPDEQP